MITPNESSAAVAVKLPTAPNADAARAKSARDVRRRPRAAGAPSRMGAFRLAHVAAALTLVVSGCATKTAGMGGGDLHAQGRPEVPVLFSWTSPDGGINGNMVATLPDATFTGPFVQITQETRREALRPLWAGWNEGWNDWPYWSRPTLGPSDPVRFTRVYSGKVVANLRDVGGRYMRCRFHLDDPARGMSGGGLGECQLAGGRSVDAIINRS